MKIKRASSNRGLGLIALLLFIAAILVIGGVIVYVLIKICRRCFPNPPPNNGDGSSLVVDFYNPATTNVTDGAIGLPAFQFPELPAPPNATAANPLGDAVVYLERSTNLVNWETILGPTNISYQMCMCDDTNPPADRAFYRMLIQYP